MQTRVMRSGQVLGTFLDQAVADLRERLRGILGLVLGESVSDASQGQSEMPGKDFGHG